MNNAQSISSTQHVAARMAGYALVIMAITAAFAFFLAIDPLIVDGDAEATTAAIAAAESLFRGGIAGFVLIAMLDVVVAAAFLILLEPVDRLLSVVAAAFRLAYAAILGAALGNLMEVGSLLRSLEAGGGTAAVSGDVMAAVDAFTGLWNVGLALFGVHLALLGYLFLRAGYVPRIVSLLVSVAGVGYLIDSFAMILSGVEPGVAELTFIGEVLLILWLLFGFRSHEPEEASTQTADDPVGAAAVS